MSATFSIPRHLTAALAITIALITASGVPAQAADAGSIQWSTDYTATETVVVTETATVDGFVGTGTASATASATATGTATAATWWEVSYLASMDAYTKATATARAAADAEARPIARQRAEEDARAKAEAGPVMIDWSTTATATETVTITEVATIDGYTGSGTASATSTASATGSASAATYWEVFYYATVDAQTRAADLARTQAEAEARPIAKQRAEDDARRQAEEGPVLIEWSTSFTADETVTVTESATVDGFEGYGTATASAQATATATAREATWWEVYYWATTRAVSQATAEARSKADAEARAAAKQLALEDAQAQADAAAEDPDPTDPGGGGQDPGGPSGPSCGPTVLKSDGTPWTCTFSDGFAGTELDQTSWSGIETATARIGVDDCYLGLEGDNVVVRDGVLRLSSHREDEPFTCEHPDSAYDTRYTAGGVTTLRKFSQTYGRFEIRAAMPDSDGPGLQSALWLVPEDPTFYGAWPSSGEIDIAEFYSNFPDRIIPALHYDSLTPWQERTNTACTLLDPTVFHTYGLEWTAQKLTVTIDGSTCVEHVLNPLAPLLGSAPFDRPFNINLTQALGVQDNSLPEGADVDRATLLVDYVRVWS